jgi:hypothetical protein
MKRRRVSIANVFATGILLVGSLSSHSYASDLPLWKNFRYGQKKGDVKESIRCSKIREVNVEHCLTNKVYSFGAYELPAILVFDNGLLKTVMFKLKSPDCKTSKEPECSLIIDFWVELLENLKMKYGYPQADPDDPQQDVLTWEKGPITITLIKVGRSLVLLSYSKTDTFDNI